MWHCSAVHRPPARPTGRHDGSGREGGESAARRALQIRGWDDFEDFTAQTAVEFLEKNADARYAVIDLAGSTTIDRTARFVSVPQPKVDGVSFSGGTGSKEHEESVRKAVESEPLRVPLDVFLCHLAAPVASAPKLGAAPTLITTFRPAEIVVLDGGLQGREIAGTGGLECITNTDGPLTTAEGSGIDE